MKSTIIAAFALLSFHAIAQTPKTTRAGADLKGPVKSTSSVTYLAEEKFGTLVKDEAFMTEFCEYNKDGFLISTKETEDEDVFNTKLIYDADNNLVEANRYQGKSELIAKFKVKYNEQGLQSITSLYKADGSLEEKNVYAYNTKNLLAKQITYDEDGKKVAEETYEYDSEGRVSKETYISENREKKMETTVTTYAYNSKGQAIKRNELHADGTHRNYKLEYDQFGNLIKEYADEENYNTYTYSYDSKNNWIKQEKVNAFSGTKAEYIYERTIKYY
jgi:YD repeat-containing protein